MSMQYVLSVSEINKYIKEIISRDLVLSNLWVKGEISNYKYHYSGHMYFTIKDDASLLKCVMFRSQTSGLKFLPENGMKVIIKGYISVFERDGQYQLYAEEMQADGIGSLHLAFEQLKKKLQAEGLFEASRKKRIPFLPGSIGVVTSPTGAVIRDIINILTRRFPNVDLKIYPVAVQGETAPAQIARAINRLNRLGNVDVIILARGGGSLEELWAFNDERVARSIYDSGIPVISAIGHETDFTIADFVADMRAPTPSAAAEIAVPEKSMLENTISTYNIRLKNALLRNLAQKRDRLARASGSTVFRQPYNRVYQERMRIDIMGKYIYKAVRLCKEKKSNGLSTLVGKLDALSPLQVIARGYSISKLKKTGRVLKSVSDVEPGDDIEICLIDGKIGCAVKDTEKEKLYVQPEGKKELRGSHGRA